MNTNIKMHKRLLYLAVVAALGGGALSCPLPAQAAIYTWNCTDGFWDYSSCWSPTGNPMANDFVRVNAANTLLQFDNLTGTRSVSSLVINSGTLNVTSLVKSGRGYGVFNFDAGTLNFSNYFSGETQSLNLIHYSQEYVL